MSANSGWMVFLNRDEVAVIRIVRGVAECSDSCPCDRQQPSESAGVISQLLEARGHTGQPVMLALGSNDVVSTTLKPSSHKALKRAALAFLVEPELPWSIEDSVIDYELAGNERVFLVAAEAAALRELITALQERGIPVASVVPFARLALEHHL